MKSVSICDKFIFNVGVQNQKSLLQKASNFATEKLNIPIAIHNLHGLGHYTQHFLTICTYYISFGIIFIGTGFSQNHATYPNKFCRQKF